jgi:hypothetical protein
MYNGGCGKDFRSGGFGADCSVRQGSLFGSGTSNETLKYSAGTLTTIGHIVVVVVEMDSLQWSSSGLG